MVQRYHHRPAEELYDLKADPYEQTNLINEPQHAAEVARLRKSLDDWMAQQSDNGLASEQENAERFYKKKPGN
jgi:uncharacterized sulfatase